MAGCDNSTYPLRRLEMVIGVSVGNDVGPIEERVILKQNETSDLISQYRRHTCCSGESSNRAVALCTLRTGFVGRLPSDQEPSRVKTMTMIDSHS